jgi:mycothiol S-conjugate amidase
MSDATTPLRLLSVHAHPDDEASKGAATVAKYAAENIRGVLVCCTGGEEGEILNPAVDTPEVRENLHAVRMQELNDSVEMIGYEKLYMLRVPRLGMKDTEANANLGTSETAARRGRRAVGAHHPQPSTRR